MSKSWLYIMGLMFAGSYLTVYMGSMLFAILIDLAILGAAYFILRRDPWTNFRSGMMFMTILTGISIVTNLGLLTHYVHTEALLALIGWTWFGLHSRMFQAFIAGCIVYNGVQIMQLYRLTSYLDIPTAVISLGAVIGLAYVNR